MNNSECVDLIRTLFGAYPNTKMDNPQGTITSYMLILGEYDAETVYKAARMYMGDYKNKYFPKAADLLKLIPLAPYMFNADSMALPEESDCGSSEDDGSDWNTGCDVCPYAEMGCKKEDCIV